MLRLPRNVIFQDHLTVHLPGKAIPTSLNVVPATKSHSKMRDTNRSVIYNGGPFDHDPNMNWSSRTRPFAEVTFRALETYFALENTIFRAPAILQKFAKCCACWKSAIPTSPNVVPVPATQSDTPTSPNIAPATNSHTPTSPKIAPATRSDTPTSPNAALAMERGSPTSPNVVPAPARVPRLRCALWKRILYWKKLENT